MSYDFSLDKKGVFSVFAGWTIMALLLFAGGLLVGMNWTTGETTASAAGSGTAATSSGNDQASLPTEPVLLKQPSQPDVAPPPPKTTGDAKSEAAAPSQTKGETQPANTSNPSLNKDTETVAPLTIVESNPQEAGSESSSASETGATESFTVQVGVFLEQDAASHLLKELERRGYAPTFFSGRDDEDRQWYAIRIGAYSDKDQASNAATNFTKQEKIKAVVRPLGSL